MSRRAVSAVIIAMLLTDILTVALNFQPLSPVSFVPKVQAGLSSGTLADAMNTIITANSWVPTTNDVGGPTSNVPHYATVFSIGNPNYYETAAQIDLANSNPVQVLQDKRMAEIDGMPLAVSDVNVQSYLSSAPMVGYVPITYMGQYFLIYDRAEAGAYRWAPSNLQSKWNAAGALAQINSIVQVGMPNSLGTYIGYSQTGGYATYYRYYDDTAETIEWFMEIGGDSYLSTCDQIWAFQQSYFWNGQYYGYNGNSRNAEMETEVGPFAIISGRYLTTRGLLSMYQDRIVSDLNQKLLINGYNSPLWNHYALNHVPGDDERRLENTAAAWAAMEAYYPVMTSTMQNTLQGMGGVGWRGLLDQSNDFDASTNQFRIWWHLTDGSICPTTTGATGVGLMVMFMNGIVPKTGSLAIPLNDEHYEDDASWSPATMFRFDYANRQIRIPVNVGTLNFIFGSGVASYTFPTTGVYTVQFSNDWNTVQSATRISPLDSEFKYIVTSSSPPPTEIIYIRADGSIVPLTAPISSVDNVTYTLTDNIAENVTGGSSAISLQRDIITIDGAGYTLQGTQASGCIGIDVTGRSNVTIKNMKIATFDFGIYLFSSSNNGISGNNLTNNYAGINVYSSSDNTICHNIFMNNTSQVYSSASTNFWDDGYPSGGNYWSDYNGTDSNSDGIGDTPYVIDANNTDRYPLMAPYETFVAGTWNGTACSVGVMNNSTVSMFQVDVAQKTIGFNVMGAEGSAGFCRVTIPNIIVQNLWQDNYTLLVDGKPWPFSSWTDTTNTYLYFNYTRSQHQTVIIPELPPLLILPMLMIATLLATITSKRKLPKHQTGSRQHPRTPCNKRFDDCAYPNASTSPAQFPFFQ